MSGSMTDPHAKDTDVARVRARLVVGGRPLASPQRVGPASWRRTARPAAGYPPPVDWPERVITARLELRPMHPNDASALFPIFNDPDGWWYAPAGRHLEIATTEHFIERAAARWPTDGLSYWTVRRRDDGAAIGLGGAQRHRSGTWNLNYRIAAAAQGQGFAGELAEAAQRAATAVDPDVAFIAWIAPHNAPSRRVAERLGLIDRGLRMDASDGEVRLALSDRVLDDAQFPPAVSHG